MIVETSAAMQKRAENVQKALGSVISSGFEQPSDVGNAPSACGRSMKIVLRPASLQLWTPATRQRVAFTCNSSSNRRTKDLAAPPWGGDDEHRRAIATHHGAALHPAKNPLVGTLPFDAAITETFIQNADQQRKQNMPFLTISAGGEGPVRQLRGEHAALAVGSAGIS